MKVVTIPNYGFNFLSIANEYSKETNSKNKLDQSVKIIIFSVTAAEAIANYEGSEYLSDKDLRNFIESGFRPKNSNKSKIYHKWDFLLGKVMTDHNRKAILTDKLESVVNVRNKLIHFKPQKNKTEQNLIPKAKKVLGPNGKLYTEFRKSGYKKKKSGILNVLTLKRAREYFKNIDELIYEYLKEKKIWPYPKFTNEYYGRRSPFWKYRKDFK
ncbi:MAG: hypothetical protein PVH61_31070 [Candidatus Aminicenantes bacterium]|jgi:hypothetical protein